jgi:hypothetical protein
MHLQDCQCHDPEGNSLRCIVNPSENEIEVMLGTVGKRVS